MDHGSFPLSEGSVSALQTGFEQSRMKKKSRLSRTGEAARWRKDVMEQEPRLTEGKI